MWKKMLPAGELPLAETLWERIMAIHPSTRTEANFLSSKKKKKKDSNTN